jgi:hypothetical protein
MGPRTHVILLLISVWLAWSVIACGGKMTGQPQAVEGVLLRVDSSSLTRIDAVVLRDDTGHEWTFRVTGETSGADGEPKPNPGHLRQHMATGDRMIVRYLDSSEGRLATQITH